MVNRRDRVFISKLIAPGERILEILEPLAEIRLGDGRKHDEDYIKTQIKDVKGIIVTMNDPITSEVMKSASKLKIISKYGVGIENIDVKAATELGIIVTNSPLNAPSVAEHTTLLILAGLRKLTHLFEHLRSGGWGLTIPPELLGGELFQKTVGIIGLGRIGVQVAKRVKCFGAKVLAYDPYIAKDKATFTKLVDLDTLLQESDIVTVHVPLTAKTRSMIGEKELKLMKPSSLLVNTSRGAVVNEKALITALEQKWIAGAGLDVLEQFPPPSNSHLFKLNNLILTPHMAGSTIEARERVVMQAADNIAQVLIGKLPPSKFIVNKELAMQTPR